MGEKRYRVTGLVREDGAIGVFARMCFDVMAADETGAREAAMEQACGRKIEWGGTTRVDEYTTAGLVLVVEY